MHRRLRPTGARPAAQRYSRSPPPAPGARTRRGYQPSLPQRRPPPARAAASPAHARRRRAACAGAPCSAGGRSDHSLTRGAPGPLSGSPRPPGCLECQRSATFGR
eukprot:scaffold73742_cov55-Phaeocystis_antarctica.AAC.2